MLLQHRHYQRITKPFPFHNPKTEKQTNSARSPIIISPVSNPPLCQPHYRLIIATHHHPISNRGSIP